MSSSKSPAEEAYKKVFNQYPILDNGAWKLFKVAFEYGRMENSTSEKSLRYRLKEKYPNLDIDEILNFFVTEIIK